MISSQMKNKLEGEMETSSLFFDKNIFTFDKDAKPELNFLDTLSPWESRQDGTYQFSERRKKKGIRQKKKTRERIKEEKQPDQSNMKRQLKLGTKDKAYSLTKQEPKLPIIDDKYRYFTVDRDDNYMTPNPLLDHKFLYSEETSSANRKRSSTKALPLLYKNSIQENYNFCAKGTNPSINGDQSIKGNIIKQKNRRRFVEDSLTNGIHESRQKTDRRLAFFAHHRSSLGNSRNKLKILSLDIQKIEKIEPN